MHKVIFGNAHAEGAPSFWLVSWSFYNPNEQSSFNFYSRSEMELFTKAGEEVDYNGQ